MADAWRWRPASNLTWTQFDDSDEWVVYDPASDDVHLLTDSARLVWNIVSDERRHPLQEIAATVATATGRTVDEPLMTAIKDALAAMDDAGLLRPLKK